MVSSAFVSTKTTLIDLKSIHKSSKYFLLNNLCVSKQQSVISLPRKRSSSYLGSNLKTPISFSDKAGYSARHRDVSINCTPESNDHLQSFLEVNKTWIHWIWGLVALLPLVVQRTLTLTKEKETTAKTVEEVEDTAEKVAENVKKLTGGASVELPEGGKLKQVVDIVDNVVKEITKDAHLTEDMKDKVEEVDQQIEPTITKGSKANVQEESKDQV